MADITSAEATEVIIADGTNDANRLLVNAFGDTVQQTLFNYLVSQDKVFTVTVSVLAAVGDADNGIVLLKNPNASGKTMRLRRIYASTDVTNTQVTFKILYAPTITLDGTAVTPRNNLIGSSTASVMAVYSLPTLSVLGTAIFTYAVPQNGSTGEIDVNIDVQANQNIVFAANPASNNRRVHITAIWAEV